MADAAERRERLIALMQEMKSDHECPLIASRNRLVFGSGNADADIAFVGEAPGAEEDRQGLPFVGRAGQFLNELLSEIGLERGEVWICNVLKCRPPGNRDPLPDEIEVCKPYLYRQIELIEPRVVCTLGNFSTKLLSGSQTGITRVHGRPQIRELGERTVTLLPMFHPAAGLRSTQCAEMMREDFRTLAALLEEAPAAEEGIHEPAAERAPAKSQLDLF